MQTKKRMLTLAVTGALLLGGCTANANIDKSIENGTSVESTDNQAGQDLEAETNEEADASLKLDSEADASMDSSVKPTGENCFDAKYAASVAAGDISIPEDANIYRTLTAEELQTIKPNELGEVMVVMYHGLGSKNAAYTRTPESFRQDLETYYEMGFRPMNLKDYVKGNITTPAGYTPMVITFDDGNKSNFNLIEENGELVIDPDCAIGIMKAFTEAHPDFELKGSFFVNGGIPFGQKEYVDYKLNWLIDNGLEVGNHSYSHEDLTDLDAEAIQKTLGKNVLEIQAIIPDYVVNTLALPFGKRPKDQDRYNLVTKGTYEGADYENIAILLVGWKPEVSVYDKSFNPEAIMRVQSGDGEFQMKDWLEDYAKHPGKRFISDGNPDVITVLAGEENQIREEVSTGKTIVTYSVEIQ